MKALSCLQPWPWLMFHGTPPKAIENRVWPLPHYLRGQRVAIHASARCDPREWGAAHDLIRAAGLDTALPPLNGIGYGAIIGTVEIVDCVIASDSPWFAGPYGFVLRNPRPLAEPVPCRGRLNFWTVSDAIAANIREQEGGRPDAGHPLRSL